MEEELRAMEEERAVRYAVHSQRERLPQPPHGEPGPAAAGRTASAEGACRDPGGRRDRAEGWGMGERKRGGREENTIRKSDMWVPRAGSWDRG